MLQILLYDAGTGELAPIGRGDAIRVEIHTADLASQGLVDVASTRPFVLFSLLQRLLESKGLPTKFLFGSHGASRVMRQLDLGAYNEDEDEEIEDDGLGLKDDLDLEDEALDVEAELEEMELTEDYGEEGAEQYTGRCVDIRFGAAREGEEEWAGDERAGRMTLTEAMARFGHHALVFYLMGIHYSQPLGDPVVGMTNAAKHVQRLRDALSKLRRHHPSPPEMRHHVETFCEALATDLDTPTAFVALFEWVLDAEERNWEVGDADLRSMLALLELADI